MSEGLLEIGKLFYIEGNWNSLSYQKTFNSFDLFLAIKN